MKFSNIHTQFPNNYIVTDFLFSIGSLNLEFNKYSAIEDSELEFELLFSEADKERIDYYYFSENSINSVNDIKSYLDIGYQNTLFNLKRKIKILNKINKAEKNLMEALEDTCSHDGQNANQILGYFKDLLSKIDVNAIDFLEKENAYENFDHGEFLSRFLFLQPEVKQYLHSSLEDNNICMVLCGAHPFLILEYLLLNTKNHQLYVQLRKKELINKVAPKINIVVEGNSDIYILKKMLSIRGKDIESFFHFTNPNREGSGNGASSNVRFFLDQKKINTKTLFLFLFDNDIAGNQALALCKDSPKNIFLRSLPNLDEKYFNNIALVDKYDKTVPCYSINAQAIAIEFFLDMDFESLSMHPPVLDISDNLQGKLKNKKKYLKSFNDLTEDKFEKYDFSKIELLIEFIFESALILIDNN